MSEITTPQQVERQLVNLMSQLEMATAELAEARTTVEQADREYKNALARARLSLAGAVPKLTVQERADKALLMCDEQFIALGAAQVALSVCRDEIYRIKQQLDATRSLGTSVRASMDFA